MIPTGFELARFSEPNIEEIIPAAGIDLDAVERVLNVRRAVMDRVFTRREVIARAKRHQAEAMQCDGRLFDGDKPLDEWQRLELEGRKEEAEAKAALCAAKARQYEMEITLYMAKLKG